MTKKQLQRGFTLIELLVVIAIVSLLTSVILASVSLARQSATNTRSLADFERIKLALQLYHNDHGGYPLCNTATTSNESQACCIGDADPSTAGDQCYILGTLVSGGLPELVGYNPQTNNQLATLAYIQKPSTGFTYNCPGNKIDRSGGGTPLCVNAYGSYFENGVEKIRWFGDDTVADPATDNTSGGGEGYSPFDGSSDGSGGPTITDTDGDSIPDTDDICPTSASDVCAATTDTDGDGQTDNVDACPNQAALTTDGCLVPDPDSDGDGIPDSTDACPNTYATTSNGCADSSGSPVGSGSSNGSNSGSGSNSGAGSGS